MSIGTALATSSSGGISGVIGHTYNSGVKVVGDLTFSADTATSSSVTRNANDSGKRYYHYAARYNTTSHNSCNNISPSDSYYYNAIQN